MLLVATMEVQQRNSGRINLHQVKGKYRILSSEDRWENCDIVNISLGGLSIKGTKSFFKGDEIEVNFPLEGEQMLAQLEVSNVHGKNCGAKFKIIHLKGKNLIQKYINRHFLQK